MWGSISLDSMRSRASSRRVFVSPDYFIDHFIRYPKAYPVLLKDLERIVRQRGGNILGTEQYVAKGGNAVNTAVALGHLGVHVTLYTMTDEIGLSLLKLFAAGLPVDLGLVDSRGSASMTAALEVPGERGQLSNIMISDSGSLSSIGPENIGNDVLSAVGRSDIVCFFNWAQTKRGTDIAEKIFTAAKQNKRCLTFIDISDPSYRQVEIPQLVSRLFRKGLVSVLSLNENELVRISESLGMPTPTDPRNPSSEFLRGFSDSLGCSIDYHTSDFSMSVSDGKVSAAPCFQVSPVRMTGAGDTWNAGDIFGYLVELDPTQRLLLANAAAGFYISNSKPKPPTLDEAAGFLKATPTKQYYPRG